MVPLDWVAWRVLELSNTEFPDYYTRLAKMEKEAEDFWKKEQ